MDLESRTFSKFYPAALDGKHYLSRSHAVKSTGFRLMPNFYYDFGITSPSTQANQRRYELSFMKKAPLGERLPENYFRGLLGESLMRIVVMEFLRQQQINLGIDSFSISKIDINNPVLRKSNEFSLEHQSRYNINLYKNDNNNPIGEYDGLIEYVAGKKKGLLIMESKTGQEGIFANPEFHNEGILDRYCYSVKNLFPDYEVDFLFMGTTDVLLSPPYAKRQLKDNFSTLKNMLFEHDTGLILFEFPLKKTDFKSMASHMANYHDLRTEDMPELSSDNRFVENGRFIWFMDGPNIIKILERADDTSWDEIYSI